MRKNYWEQTAEYLEEQFGAYVNWEERFYICPNCQEPIYEEDYSEKVDYSNLCPVCYFGEDYEKGCEN